MKWSIKDSKCLIHNYNDEVEQHNKYDFQTIQVKNKIEKFEDSTTEK